MTATLLAVCGLFALNKRCEDKCRQDYIRRVLAACQPHDEGE
jgi:hypothetical protein